MCNAIELFITSFEIVVFKEYNMNSKNSFDRVFVVWDYCKCESNF